MADLSEGTMCDERTKQIIKRFSTYWVFRDSDQGRARLTLVPFQNHRLKVVVKELMRSQPDANEEFLARLILESLQTTHQDDRDRELCLFCYLNPLALSAATQISNDLKKTPNRQLHLSVYDCFMYAWGKAKYSYLLKGFHLKKGNSLEAYARQTIVFQITAAVRENHYRNFKRSDTWLLTHESKKQFEAALLDFGIVREELPRYLLLRQVFSEMIDEFYVPTNSRGQRNLPKSLSDLDPKNLKWIVERYNQRILQKNIALISIDINDAKRMLIHCIQAIHKLEWAWISDIEETSQILEDECSVDQSRKDSELIKYISHHQELFDQAFSLLKPDTQIALKLWKGLRVTQTDLGPFLNKRQDNVSRYFSSQINTIYKNLERSDIWKPIAHLSLHEKNIEIDSRKKNIHKFIDWVAKEKFGSLAKRNSTEKETSLLLKNISHSRPLPFRELREWAINNETPDSLNQPCKKTLSILIHWHQAFTKSIADDLQIDLRQFRSAPEKIARFLEQWLEENQAVLRIEEVE